MIQELGCWVIGCWIHVVVTAFHCLLTSTFGSISPFILPRTFTKFAFCCFCYPKLPTSQGQWHNSEQKIHVAVSEDCGEHLGFFVLGLFVVFSWQSRFIKLSGKLPQVLSRTVGPVLSPSLYKWSCLLSKSLWQEWVWVQVWPKKSIPWKSMVRPQISLILVHSLELTSDS